MEVELNI